MHLALDILLVGVWGLFAYFGWRRGFVGAVLRFARLILSLVITVALSSSVAAWINTRWVYGAVLIRVLGVFDELATKVTGGVDGLIEQIPGVLRGYMDVSKIDPSAGVEGVARDLAEGVAGGLSRTISSVLGAIGLFILCYILGTIALIVADKLVKLPFICTVDSLLGLGIGGISGGLAVMFLSAVVGAVLILRGDTAIAEASFMLRLCAGLRMGMFGGA